MSSVSKNYFCQEFNYLYGNYSKTEYLIIAHLRNKIPTICALKNIIEYYRNPVMDSNLSREINIEGTISTVHHLNQQQTNDYREHTKKMLNICEKKLEQMQKNNKNKDYCPILHTIIPNHHCVHCDHCSSHVYDRYERSLPPDKRDINESYFINKYYNRKECIKMIQKLYSCKCCYHHQILSRHYVNEYKEGTELDIFQPKQGDIIPSLSISPNTVYQSKLPKCYHNDCNCKCEEMLYSLIIDFDEMKHTFPFLSW